MSVRSTSVLAVPKSLFILMTLLAGCALLSACGRKTTPEEETEQVSAGTLTLTSPDPKTFVPTTRTVRFTVSGATLSSAPGDTCVLENGNDLPASDSRVSGRGIVIPRALADGPNTLVVLANDTRGGALTAETTLWAGSATFYVSVSGQGSLNATVMARLGDAPSVSENVACTNGQATLTNVPARTVMLMATTPDNNFAATDTSFMAGA